MNPSNSATEQQIAQEIIQLRAKFSDTRQLYQEVCALLFFRFGIAPTANKLYQLVHKGSMSAPTEALRLFWENLREKSRVRIEHPDLPDELKSAAATLVMTLWEQAQSRAQQGLAQLRQESVQAVQAAEARQAQAEAAQWQLQQALQLSERDGQQLTQQNLQLERALSGECAARQALQAQLEQGQQQQHQQEQALQQARQDFSSELAKMRQALQHSEERCLATERHALLEIDRERTQASRLQKELHGALQVAKTESEQLQQEKIQLNQLMGDLRQQLGMSEGQLQQLRETGQQTQAQLQQLQARLVEQQLTCSLMQQSLALADQREKQWALQLVTLTEHCAGGEVRA